MHSGLLESLLTEKEVMNQEVPLRQSFSKDSSDITYGAAYECGFSGFVGVA